MLCKNASHRHECHPYYAKKYDGYCLECANAGIPDLIEELDRERAAHRETRQRLAMYDAVEDAKQRAEAR